MNTSQRNEHIFNVISTGEKRVTEMAEELGITKQAVSAIFKREAAKRNFTTSARVINLNNEMHRLYDIMCKFIETHGRDPKQRELAELMGCKQGRISDLLRRMGEQGYLDDFECTCLPDGNACHACKRRNKANDNE